MTRGLLLPALFTALLFSACAGNPPKPEPPPKKAPPEETLKVAPEAAPVHAVRQEKDAAGCTWIQSEGTVTMGENDSLYQGRAAAIEQARISAMQDFLGVEVKSRFLDFQQEGLRHQQSLTESLLQTTRNGRILKEDVIFKERRDTPNCEGCRYYVKLRDCIVEVPSTADKDFSVELGLSRQNYEEGDEAKITVRATRDSFIYLYDVSQDGGESMLLVPNEYVGQVTLAAGKTWEYPDGDAKNRGIRLIAQMPESKPPVSAEIIRVIATKVPMSTKVVDPANGGYLGVVQRMHASKTDWVEDTKFFTIARKQ